ncbi:MAG: hypothetical protein MUC74_08725 [Ideonella sp.]|jgi:hypothetical protein|nr:hypothetical protein [Ideonella sp.]
MLRTVKRWMGLAPPPVDWGIVPSWCEGRGLSFRRERDDRGFVIEGRTEGLDWRLEWGPPQRDYLIHPELRLRCELAGPDGLHLLVMTTPLADALERLAFERLTEANRTEADIAMAEEGRWVSMYPAADLAAWRGLRSRVRVCGSDPAALRDWLAAGLADAVGRALDRGPVRDPAVFDPLVVMTLRGRLYLRTALSRPDPGALELCLSLAQEAIRATRDTFARHSNLRHDDDGGDPGATAWQTEAPDPRIAPPPAG